MRFENDLKKGVVTLDETGKFSKNLPSNYKAVIPPIPNNIKAIYDKIRECILHRGTAMPGNDDKRKAFLLLANCRSPTLSKEELKLGCLYRLSLPITDEHVSIIFNHFDKNKTGQISVKQLVDEVMQEKMDFEAKFQNTLDLSRSSKTGSLANSTNQYGPLPSEEAYMKFDKTFHNLEEPSNHHLITKMTLLQLEESIRDKVTQNCKQNMNLLQALSRSFGDNRERDAKFKVSLHQMKFTIWKKLMIYASEELIESLFKKYDPNNTGYIDLHHFADGVMKKTISYKPIVEEITNKFAMKIKTGDAQLRFGQVYSPIIVSFLEHMRAKFKEYVNNNCRSPVYLVNSTNRMNPVQAKKFLEDQFKVVVGDNVLKELINEYDDNGLLNMKRLLKDCMVVDMDGKLGPDVNLITSSLITVDEMPLSVRSNKQSFDSIQMRFREKVQERLRNDQPLSYLHLMFRSKENDKDPRLISKLGLRKVLYKQDITLSDADYDDYFRHFDRGDGKVVIRDFLLELLPPANRGDDNTFLPKKDVNFKAQDMLSRSLALLTGKKRDVGSINGDELNRFRGSIVQQVEDTIASSKRMDTTNDVTASEFFRSINNNSDFNQKRSESPRTDSIRADSPRAESPSTSRSKVDTPTGATAKSHDPKYSIITHQKKDYMKDDKNNSNHNSNVTSNNNNNNNNSHNGNNYSEESDLTRRILDKKVNNQEESAEEIAFQIGRAAAIAAAQSRDNKDIASQIGIAAATYALNLLMNENKESFNQTKEAQNVSRPSSAQQRQSVKIRPQSAPVKNDLLMNASLRMNELEDQYSSVRGANPPSKWQLSQGSLHQDSVGSINSTNNFSQMKTFDMGITMQSPSRPPSASRPSSSRPSSARPPSASRPIRPEGNQREQSMSPAPPFRPSPSKPSPSTTSSPTGSPRSPREKKFTYTGIRRSGEMNPHHQALAVKYKFVSNNIKQSSNDYGSYFKTVQNEKMKNEKMMQKYREYLQKQKELEDEGKSGIHINPSHSQRSFSARPPGRYSQSNLQSQTPRGRSASPSLNQNLANYGLEHDKWKKYSSPKPTIKKGSAAAETFAAYAVMTPGKVTQINKKFALQWHKNAKKK